MLCDHPPAIVEDLSVIFLRAEILESILAKKLIVLLIKPTIEFRPISIEVV